MTVWCRRLMSASLILFCYIWTEYTILESDKNKQENIRYKRVESYALSQQVTTRLQGTDSTVRQRQKRNTSNKRIHKRSTGLEKSVRKILEGLNMFDCANLALMSDVNQDIIDVWFAWKIPNLWNNISASLLYEAGLHHCCTSHM